jgi:hypothetical protein
MTEAARVQMAWHCAARPFPLLPKARIEKTRAPHAQITEQHRVRKLAGEVQAAARAARERQGLTRRQKQSGTACASWQGECKRRRGQRVCGGY